MNLMPGQIDPVDLITAQLLIKVQELEQEKDKVAKLEKELTDKTAALALSGRDLKVAIVIAVLSCLLNLAAFVRNIPALWELIK
ncbi:MAG: hypothetical protein WC750_02560 [Patescibacteria group bacterium]|jgi:hypothetical protein